MRTNTGRRKCSRYIITGFKVSACIAVVLACLTIGFTLRDIKNNAGKPVPTFHGPVQAVCNDPIRLRMANKLFFIPFKYADVQSIKTAELISYQERFFFIPTHTVSSHPTIPLKCPQEKVSDVLELTGHLNKEFLQINEAPIYKFLSVDEGLKDPYLVQKDEWGWKKKKIETLPIKNEFYYGHSLRTGEGVYISTHTKSPNGYPVVFKCGYGKTPFLLCHNKILKNGTLFEVWLSTETVPIEQWHEFYKKMELIRDAFEQAPINDVTDTISTPP